MSHHNFEETPDNLEDIYKRIEDKNPDIIKIATKANSPADSLKMLELVQNSKKDIIGICMGEYGLVTRVYGPDLGSYLTFASMPGKASAPGQLSVNQVRAAWKKIDEINEICQYL